MSFYITEKSMHDVLTAAKGIQKTANEKLNEKISLETALQVMCTLALSEKIMHLSGNINNHNLILRHEDY